MPPKKTAEADTKTKPAKEEAPKRVKLSELPQKERDAKAEEAIRELYKTTDQTDKRKIRARLRNINENWTDTYAKLVERFAPEPAPKVEKKKDEPKAKSKAKE